MFSKLVEIFLSSRDFFEWLRSFRRGWSVVIISVVLSFFRELKVFSWELKAFLGGDEIFSK